MFSFISSHECPFCYHLILISFGMFYFFVLIFLFISFSSTAFQNHRDQILNPDRTPTKPTTTVASVATATLPLQPTNVSNVPTSVAQLQFPTQPVSPNPAQMVAQLPREYIGLFLFNICFYSIYILFVQYLTSACLFFHWDSTNIKAKVHTEGPHPKTG